jgi:hypothetical protein
MPSARSVTWAGTHAIVRLATIGPDGPTGSLSDCDGDVLC